MYFTSERTKSVLHSYAPVKKVDRILVLECQHSIPVYVELEGQTLAPFTAVLNLTAEVGTQGHTLIFSLSLSRIRKVMVQKLLTNKYLKSGS